MTIRVAFGLFCLVVAMAGCSKWSDEERKILLNDCIKAAEKQGYEQPQEHCKCVLHRIERLYPNPDDFEQISIEQLSVVVQACQDSLLEAPIFWPEHTRAVFLDSCMRQSAARGITHPAQFCECVIAESMKQFKSAADLSRLTPELMQQIGEKCNQEID